MLVGIGIGLTLLGMILLLDKVLLTIGNLCFVAGAILTVGPKNATSFFFTKKRLRGTIIMCLGIFLVFIGWPFFGIVLEGFGFINLFGNFLPAALTVLRNTPIIGRFFRIPIVHRFCIRLTQKRDKRRDFTV
ncbi:hypothetical protein PCE1_003727 [Barthelona sp. PCE]